MEKDYKTLIGTFKSSQYFFDKGMLAGQNDYNDNFYDAFAGKTCEFAVFEDGETFHVDTKIQVNPEDVNFGCDLCLKKQPIIINNDRGLEGSVNIGEDLKLNINGYDESEIYDVKINYCPICGRKLETD